jgi:putative FmdB family regulatory protein
MPIYAYRCASCGHAQDVLQKMSDPVLTVCPACGASTFSKQLTAAGFQLKGSGWYVTDFRGGSTPAKKDAAADAPADKASDKPVEKHAEKAADKPSAPASADKAAATPAAPSA